MLRSLLRQPMPSDETTFANTVQDAIGGIVIVALIVVAVMWCAP